MNHFAYEPDNDIDFNYDCFGDPAAAEFVLNALFFAGVDYQSAICWRYFDKVLKQMAHEHDYETLFGIDNGLIMCVNEPISEVVEALGGGG